MKTQAHSQINATKSPVFTPVQGGLLQRKCACGNYTIAGGECAKCAKNKSGLQRKLTIGTSNDPLELEAGRVADRVMAEPASATVSGAPPRIQRYAGQAGEAVNSAPASVERVLANSGRPLEPVLRQDMEQRFGHDFSQVRVHSGSAAEQSAREVNANAYTVGHNVVFGAGQFAPGTHWGQRLLAHELTHVVQQTHADGNHVGESKEKRVLSSISTTGNASGGPVQRMVRIDSGTTKVSSGIYEKDKPKATVGSKFLVANLIADTVKRAFTNIAELESYANGMTDYIGDVKTTAGPAYWYRLPKAKLTVLGEYHHNVKGNVEDVILGLGTSRFMYEPFNELASVKALPVPFTGTQTRLTQINTKGIKVGGLVDRTKFNPDLENIVIKALTGASVARNTYIAASPAMMSTVDKKEWQSRLSTNEYSLGERIALYLSMGIHLASDISKHNFGPKNFVETMFVMSCRNLKNFYIKNQAVLDAFMLAKDTDELIGIYELTEPNSFKNLPVIKDFTLVLHEYCTRYIEQLGSESGNMALEAEGKSLRGNLGADLDAFSPAREAIMWEKIQVALKGGYLIVGMGDAHRKNLDPRLKKASIAHEEVEASLARQQAEVNKAWKP